MALQPTHGKIKILRVITRLNIGGPAIHVVNLTACLAPARFEQRLVVGTEALEEGSMLEDAFSRGVHPIIIPEIVNEFKLTLRDLKALAQLYRLIRQEQPHIVDTHTAKAGLLGRLAALLAGVPIVIHTYHGHILHGYYGPLKTWFLRSMERTLALITDQIITVSDQVKRELVSYTVAPSSKIAVIPLGFDLQPFLACQDQRGQFRRELGLDDGVRLVAIVGRLYPIKNHRLFLDAAAHVALPEPSTRFVIVGDGVLRPAMQQHAHELGIADRVIFTGWRRDLPRVYADTDILVVSSNNEGTPVAAIEAMAAGRPVIATRVGGLPDLITEGETGLLIPPKDPHGLATAMLRLLQDPETAWRMGQAGQAMVRERFSLQRLLTDMEQCYHQLLTQNGFPGRVPPACG